MAALGQPSAAPSHVELSASSKNLPLAGLTQSAPWRFAEAYAAWLAERGGRPKPVTLFGLKGLGQSGLVLRLEFSGGNLILPRALWTVPADLL
jgi:hypothetical protein